MIKAIKLSRLISAEIYQFFFLIVEIAAAANSSKQKIKPQLDALAELVARLLAALNREQANALSKVLDNLDVRRDTAITGFTLWVKALTMHPNANIKAAATALKLYLKNQGDNIANQNQQKETATLTKFVTDCRTDIELQKHVETLNDPAWLIEIENSNNEFIAIYQQRSSEMGKESQKESFSAVRRLAVVAYQELSSIITTRYNVAKEDKQDIAELQKLVGDINATIGQYKQLIAQTKTHKKKEEPKA